MTDTENTEARDPSNTDVELLTAPLDDDDDVLNLIDKQEPDELTEDTSEDAETDQQSS